MYFFLIFSYLCLIILFLLSYNIIILQKQNQKLIGDLQVLKKNFPIHAEESLIQNKINIDNLEIMGFVFSVTNFYFYVIIVLIIITFGTILLTGFIMKPLYSFETLISQMKQILIQIKVAEFKRRLIKLILSLSISIFIWVGYRLELWEFLVKTLNANTLQYPGVGVLNYVHILLACIVGFFLRKVLSRF